MARSDGPSESGDPDRYFTVADGPESEIKVQGSRFIGRTFHVSSEQEAAAALERVRRRHHAARHHCWAARIGPPGALRARSDDAGEPSGTGGRPILARLERRAVHDALLVVTRYFGGTKLGTGGLARAYGDAAEAALDATPLEVVRIETRLVIDCAFEDLGAVEALLARAGSDVHAIEREFTPGPRLTLRVRRGAADALCTAIIDATSGRARSVVVG